MADAYGASEPTGGGAVHGKDPLKVDPPGQARARQMALDIVLGGEAEEATVWLAWRPGDAEPRWIEIREVGLAVNDRTIKDICGS